MFKLTKEGKKYLEKGLPERRLIEALAKNDLAMQAIKTLEDSGIAINWAKKNNWIQIKDGLVSLTKEWHHILLGTSELERGLKNPNSANKEIIQVMLSRNLIQEAREDIIKKAESQLTGEITNLTSELIKTGLWKNAKLKSYNVEALGKKVYPGRIHPLMQIANKVRNIFVSMGFQEMEGQFVESSYNNFDILFMPQDHPGREVMDTFFMKTPAKSKTLPKDYKLIKEVHETGGRTGSTGWNYEWKEEVAKTNVLRTHTTATTFRVISSGVKIPCKYFSIDRVFRNETIDFKHLPEFFQIEGFIAADGLTLRHMMGVFKHFYSELGIDKIRFKPTCNPYTEPSMEIFAYYKPLKKWIELGNSGMFRPETLLPWGVKVPVIAWGLALERLAMLVYDVKDIRQILGPTVDIDFIRNYPMVK